MKKIVLFLLGIGLLPGAVGAQKLSLDDALKMAIDNRFELKNQQLQLRIAEGEEAKLRAKWVPQVNASADMRWNTQLQTSVFKNAPFANGQDVKLVLGVPFNNNVGISAEQKVYDAATKYDRLINSETVEGQKIGWSRFRGFWQQHAGRADLPAHLHARHQGHERRDEDEESVWSHGGVLIKYMIEYAYSRVLQTIFQT